MTLEEALAHLRKENCVQAKRLYSLGWYLCWEPGDPHAVLDGEYSADDLMAIAVVMKEWKP